MPKDLTESREKIDEIDRQIVRLFQERMAVSAEVAAVKKETGKAVFDPKREEEKLRILCDLAEGDFNKISVEDLFRQIMSISRKYQYQVLGTSQAIPFARVETLETDASARVACFGEHGAFSEQAMEEVFGGQVGVIFKQTFREVMALVAKGDADYGVLPIENSSTGGITDIYDLLCDYDVTIVAEHVIPITQELLGLPGAKLSDIQTVYSHPQGLMQSADFLRAHPAMQAKEFSSTSGAAKKVAQDKDKTQAAIASARAGQKYGLKVLCPTVNGEKENSTRFIVISHKKIYLADANKLSLCFEIRHRVGALYHMLSNFYYNNLNLTKIESRPIKNHNWEYRFFVDVEGNIFSPGVGNALESVREFADKLTVLGNIAKR